MNKLLVKLGSICSFKNKRRQNKSKILDNEKTFGSMELHLDPQMRRKVNDLFGVFQLKVRLD